MAMFGINFGAGPIPDQYRRQFAEVKRCGVANVQVRPREGASGSRPLSTTVGARLVGVCTTEAERDQMIITANNGHRWIWVVERPNASGCWWGIYVY